MVVRNGDFEKKRAKEISEKIRSSVYGCVVIDESARPIVKFKGYWSRGRGRRDELFHLMSQVITFGEDKKGDEFYHIARNCGYNPFEQYFSVVSGGDDSRDNKIRTAIAQLMLDMKGVLEDVFDVSYPNSNSNPNSIREGERGEEKRERGEGEGNLYCYLYNHAFDVFKKKGWTVVWTL